MKWMVASVCAALLAAVGVAGAQDLHLPPGAWWDAPEVAGRLGLSGQQKDDIRELLFAHARRMIDLNAEVKRQELALAELVGRAELDQPAVRAAFAAFQQARQRLELERFELLLAVRQVLNPEQWEKLQLMNRRARQMMEERRGAEPPPGARRPLRPGGGRPGS